MNQMSSLQNLSQTVINRKLYNYQPVPGYYSLNGCDVVKWEYIFICNFSFWLPLLPQEFCSADGPVYSVHKMVTQLDFICCFYCFVNFWQYPQVCIVCFFSVLWKYELLVVPALLNTKRLQINKFLFEQNWRRVKYKKYSSKPWNL